MRKDGVIFLLENSTEYVFNLDQSFRNAQVHNPLRIARYGNEAILYLKGVGIYGDRSRYPLPDLIIIDLANPDGSSLAVLGWIRRQPEFNSVPVIILVEEEIETPAGKKAFDRVPNAHCMKRNDLATLAQVIKFAPATALPDSSENSAQPTAGAPP